VVLVGCGFHSSAVAPVDAAAPADAAAPSCLPRWLDDAGPALSSPQPLTALTSDGEERDPWITPDGLQLYFDRNPGIHLNYDIYAAARTSPAGEFASPAAVDNLDTSADDSRASLDGDGTLLALSSNRATGKFQIFVSTRGDATQPFPSPSSPDQAMVISVNANADNLYDPFLSSDGLRLYLAPAVIGAAQQVAVATRTAGGSFGAWTPLAMINSGAGEADPALSPDERVIVFTSSRTVAGFARTNLWYATRQRATDPFSAPRLIPTVNGDADDGDPMLGADGCELYFSSNRTGGKYHLFRAQVAM
jgi:Tol biopolymer transport system component